jgi:hypothetical protein
MLPGFMVAITCISDINEKGDETGISLAGG